MEQRTIGSSAHLLDGSPRVPFLRLPAVDTTALANRGYLANYRVAVPFGEPGKRLPAGYQRWDPALSPCSNDLLDGFWPALPTHLVDDQNRAGLEQSDVIEPALVL